MPLANTVTEYEELIAAQFDNPNFAELNQLFTELAALKAAEKAAAAAAAQAETERKIKVDQLTHRWTAWRHGHSGNV